MMTGVAGAMRPMIVTPEEDPDSLRHFSSPPCFMHELDPSYFGYLADGEVAALLWDLLGTARPGTMLETAWVRAMLRRHLAHLGAGTPREMRGRAPDPPPADAGIEPQGGEPHGLAGRLRDVLPRLHDPALRRDLIQLLDMLERDIRMDDPCPGIDPAMLRWKEVRRWRKAQRELLIASRLAARAEERRQRDALVTPGLRACLPASGGSSVIGFYWPFKGEYDPRPLMRELHSLGMRLALPVVAEMARPLIFREWRPGLRMVPGVWGIPVPAEGDAVLPDTLVAPLVGFDGLGYRLGYGGGYYDRTLAAMPKRPLAIGVGFELSRLETIHPQPHDIPMHFIVTERQVTSIADRQPEAAGAQARCGRGDG